MGSETDEVGSLLEESSDILDINEVSYNIFDSFSQAVIFTLSNVFFFKINDVEYDIPTVSTPSLESILWDMESEEGSDSASLHSLQSMTLKFRSMLYHCVLQGLTAQITSAEVSSLYCFKFLPHVIDSYLILEQTFFLTAFTYNGNTFL